MKINEWSVSDVGIAWTIDTSDSEDISPRGRTMC